MANVLQKYTWPWAALATVLVLGFMIWLYAESTSLESTLVVDETSAEVPVVADTTFVQDPTRFARQRSPSS